MIWVDTALERLSSQTTQQKSTDLKQQQKQPKHSTNCRAMGGLLWKLIVCQTQAQPKGIVQLVNNLAGGADKALTAEQGKVLLAMFSNSLLSSGYQKIPNPLNPSEPLIMQWGGSSVGKGAVLDVTLPIAYPDSHLRAFGDTSK